jgi:CheY-like chemotaxis protein
VVVGHEVPAAARTVATTLRSGDYAPVVVKSGEQVLAACDPSLPSPVAAVILDVAIPGVLAFEVIEQLRAHPATKKLPVILLASVFERTRYKRKATNLYGADAYLELHHVPDRLVAVVDSLRNDIPIGDDRLQAPVERARAAGLRGRTTPDDLDAAHALARRLLSDVVLYHGDEVADGVRRGQPFASLASAVDNARELFKDASNKGEVFEIELQSLSSRLLDRDASRSRSADG